MSTWVNRDFRPKIHYTPPYGWINDPNGLVCVNGEYHLFAQYYPYDTVWGPMHWIHATSKDLLHWQQIGIALRPDEELGAIFSGSAIACKGNVGRNGNSKDILVCMFTHHGTVEQQSIAWSEDGVHFTKFAKNPVIPNPGIRDFRDPKIFQNPVRGGWSVIIAAGDHVDFYRSNNLIDWIKTGEFGREENARPGIYECPDIFPLTAPNGEEMWVLTCSNCYPVEEGGNRMQYFLGKFDGNTFHRTVKWEAPMLFDQGFDNYAAVTFAGCRKSIQMGWAANWTYAGKLPTGEFCGQMTIARELRLADTPNGMRLASTPILPQATFTPLTSGTELPGQCFCLHIRAEGAFEARLENEKEHFLFGLDNDENFYTDRSKAGMKDFDQNFSLDLYARTKTKRLFRGTVEMTIVFDVSIVEIFADSGTYVNSTLVYPQEPYTRFRLIGAQAEIAPLA